MLNLHTYESAVAAYKVVPRTLFEEGVASGDLASINRGNVVLLREENIDAYLISLESDKPPIRKLHERKNGQRH